MTTKSLLVSIAAVAVALTTQVSAWSTPLPPRIGKTTGHPRITTAVNAVAISAPSSLDLDDSKSPPITATPKNPLSLTVDELAQILDGKGKAQACWDCFRMGVDPLWYFNTDDTTTTSDEQEPLDALVQQLLLDEQQQKGKDNINLKGWTRSQLKTLITPRRQSQGLGQKSLQTYQTAFAAASDTANISIPTDSMSSIAKIVQIHRSSDGTTKLLLELVQDKLQVECVIIPWSERQSSTLCLSNQVGCGQGCTFCSTGRMGELRSLTSDEILVQYYWASKVARLLPNDLYRIDAIVFMGMGEAARNAHNVVVAATTLTDPQQFQLAPRRVTISTVGPTPESFVALGKAPAVLAWSVHASDDVVRKQLVPTTRHTMVELRDALIQVLLDRPRKLRQVMLEFALIGGINDRPEDAAHLIAFCQTFYQDVPGVKLVVNLIPWNDISATSGPAANYQKPTADDIQVFQDLLVKENVLCYVRTTRGDDESAACGQLATKAKKTTATQKN